MRATAVSIATSLVASLAGCALDKAGTAGDEPFLDEDARPDAALAETPADAEIDTSAPDTTDDDTSAPDTLVADTYVVDTLMPDGDGSTCNETACGAPLPSGAKRVALVDRGIACPPGFKATDVVEGKTGDGCTCSCTVAVAPLCPSTGSVQIHHGTSATCATTGNVLYPPGSGVCMPLGFPGVVADYVRLTPPAPLGGACVPASTADKNAVVRPRRLCEPLSGTCAAAICASPFTECIEYAGACPTAFPNAVPVGSDAYVTCPTCTCSISATCTGTLSLFNTAGCGGTAIPIPADDVCRSQPSAGASVSHYKYAANPPAGPACKASFTAAPGTRTIIGQRNLCCR